jgi:MFS family permease
MKYRDRKQNKMINQTIIVSRNAWITLAILSGTLLTVFFSETMLLPAIPDIITDLDISYGTAAWIFSAYLIVAAVMTPIAGRLSDLYGKKKVLLTLLAVYIAGLVAGGFADNITMLLSTRIIQGFGLAAVPAAFSLLRDTFPPAKLSIAVGVFGSAYSAGSVIGLLIGASIIQHFGWHSTFLAIIPFSIIVAVLIAKFVKEQNEQSTIENQKRETKPAKAGDRSSILDFKGIITLSITITSFLIALTAVQIGITNENIPLISSSFAISAVSLVIFATIERKISNPFVNLNLLKHKVLLPSYILLVVTGITMFMIYPTIVQIVRSPVPWGFGGNSVDAANVQLPFMIAFLIFASITPFIINKIGSARPALIGGIISLTGGTGLLLFHSSGIQLSTSLAVVATGLSLTMTATWNLVVSGAPKEFTGISVGVGALLLFIGMAIGPALAGVYMSDHVTNATLETYPSPKSYANIFLTASLLSIVAIVFSLFLMKKPKNVVNTNADHSDK